MFPCRATGNPDRLAELHDVVAELGTTSLCLSQFKWAAKITYGTDRQLALSVHTGQHHFMDDKHLAYAFAVSLQDVLLAGTAVVRGPCGSRVGDLDRELPRHLRRRVCRCAKVPRRF